MSQISLSCSGLRRSRRPAAVGAGCDRPACASYLEPCSAGYSNRKRLALRYSSDNSNPSQRRPSDSEAAPVAFEPANGSRTRSPSSVRRRTKKLGSAAGNRAGWSRATTVSGLDPRAERRFTRPCRSPRPQHSKEPANNEAHDRNDRQNFESFVFHPPTEGLPLSLNRRHRECTSPPQPLDDGFPCYRRQRAPRLIKSRIVVA